MACYACSFSVNLRLGILLMKLRILVARLGYLDLPYFAMFALRRKIEGK
jgi:hypothetical protein